MLTFNHSEAFKNLGRPATGGCRSDPTSFAQRCNTNAIYIEMYICQTYIYTYMSDNLFIHLAENQTLVRASSAYMERVIKEWTCREQQGVKSFKIDGHQSLKVFHRAKCSGHSTFLHRGSTFLLTLRLGQDKSKVLLRGATIPTCRRAIYVYALCLHLRTITFRRLVPMPRSDNRFLGVSSHLAQLSLISHPNLFTKSKGIFAVIILMTFTLNLALTFNEYV
jgi:hypothetical protein